MRSVLPESGGPRRTSSGQDGSSRAVAASSFGKKIALVANLKPAKLMGVESNGMVLAASLDGKAVRMFDADVPPGTKIK